MHANVQKVNLASCFGTLYMEVFCFKTIPKNTYKPVKKIKKIQILTMLVVKSFGNTANKNFNQGLNFKM